MRTLALALTGHTTFLSLYYIICLYGLSSVLHGWMGLTSTCGSMHACGPSQTQIFTYTPVHAVQPLCNRLGIVEMQRQQTRPYQSAALRVRPRYRMPHRRSSRTRGLNHWHLGDPAMVIRPPAPRRQSWCQWSTLSARVRYVQRSAEFLESLLQPSAVC